MHVSIIYVLYIIRVDKSLYSDNAYEGHCIIRYSQTFQTPKITTYTIKAAVMGK